MLLNWVTWEWMLLPLLVLNCYMGVDLAAMVSVTELGDMGVDVATIV